MAGFWKEGWVKRMGSQPLESFLGDRALVFLDSTSHRNLGVLESWRLGFGKRILDFCAWHWEMDILETWSLVDFRGVLRLVPGTRWEMGLGGGMATSHLFNGLAVFHCGHDFDYGLRSATGW